MISVVMLITKRTTDNSTIENNDVFNNDNVNDNLKTGCLVT